MPNVSGSAKQDEEGQMQPTEEATDEPDGNPTDDKVKDDDKTGSTTEESPPDQNANVSLADCGDFYCGDVLQQE